MLNRQLERSNTRIAMTSCAIAGTKFTDISLSHLRSGMERVLRVRTQFADEALTAIRALLENNPTASFNYVPFTDKLDYLELGFGY